MRARWAARAALARGADRARRQQCQRPAGARLPGGPRRRVGLLHAQFLRSADAAPSAAQDGAGAQAGGSSTGTRAAARRGRGPKRWGRAKEGADSAAWDPLAEGAWHPDFDLQATKLEAVREAVAKAEGELAAKRGSGSGERGRRRHRCGGQLPSYL